jgi:flagellar assembly factor FliW
MNVIEHNQLQTLQVKSENVVKLPLGLLGLEQIKNYVLLSNADEAPFMWLQMLEDPNHSFLVISPFEVCADYQPEISDEDVAFLGLSSPEDALVINIVNLSDMNRATVNLKGPILVNRHTLIGKQVIPVNAAQYSLQYPLPVAA